MNEHENHFGQKIALASSQRCLELFLLKTFCYKAAAKFTGTHPIFARQASR